MSTSHHNSTSSIFSQKILSWHLVVSCLTKQHFLFSVFFVLTSVCLFAALFEIQLKKNVLQPQDQRRGFSSTDKAQLGYSFWILLGSAGVLLICPLIILMKNIHCTHYFKTRKHEISTVDGVMLY